MIISLFSVVPVVMCDRQPTSKPHLARAILYVLDQLSLPTGMLFTHIMDRIRESLMERT